MQSTEFTYLVEMYRLHERRRRAEEEWRIRRLLAQPNESAQRRLGSALWLRLVQFWKSRPSANRGIGQNESASSSNAGGVL